MYRMSPRHRLLFALSLTPPLLVAWAIIEYGVDLVDWDQWEVAGFFEKAARGSLSLGDLFAQQAEYRQFFPNLIFVGLGWLTRWNIKAEMFVSLALACLVALNLCRLTHLTAGGDASRRMLLTLVSSLLIFSPAQFENWLLGEQIIYFMPIACLTTGLRVAYAGAGRPAAYVVCAVLSTVGTFSSANGIICWLVLPVVLFPPLRQRGRRYVYYAAWALGFSLNLAAYLYGYHKPPYTPSPSESLHHPAEGALFFFALLGAPLATSHRLMPVAASVGALAALLFIASCLYSLKSATDRALAERAAGWVSLGAYSFLTALVVTVSRLGYGTYQSLNSRYTTFSLYLLVSLCHLTPIIIDDLRVKGRAARVGNFARRLTPVAFSVIVLLHLFNSAASLRQMAWMKTRRLQAKACLLFINAAPDKCLGVGFPGMDVLRPRAKAINDLGFLRPPLITSNRVGAIASSTEAAFGRFDNLKEAHDGVLTATGWACLPGRGRPADAVLLAYAEDSGEPVIFAMAQMRAGPPSLSALLGKIDSDTCRWEKSISPGEAPAFPMRLSAWAFDATEGKAHKLAGGYNIKSVSGGLYYQDEGSP